MNDSKNGNKTKQSSLISPNQDRMFTLFNSSPTGMLVVGEEAGVFVITDVNPMACRLSGYTREELIGMSLAEMYGTDREPLILQQNLISQIAENGVATKEIIFFKKNGESLFLILSVTPIDPLDFSCGYIFNILDISEQKKIEADLRSAREESDLLIERLSEAEEIAGISSFLFDFQKGEMWGSRRFFEFYGVKTERGAVLPLDDSKEMVENIYFEEHGELLHWTKLYMNLSQIFDIDWNNTKDHYFSEFYIKQSEGNFLPVRNKFTITMHKGILATVKGTQMDISKENQQRFELVESMRKLKQTERISGSGSWEINLLSKTFFLSDNLSSLFFKNAGEMDLPYQEFINLFDKLLILKNGETLPLSDFRRVPDLFGLKSKESGEFKDIHQMESISSINGKDIYLMNYYYPMIKNGKIEKIIGIARDITQEKEFELKLVEARENAEANEKKISSLFNVAPVGLGVVKNKVFIEINKSTCDLLGYTKEELLGQNGRIFYPNKEEYERITHDLYSRLPEEDLVRDETLFIRKDGKLINVLISLILMDKDDLEKGVIFTFYDITDRKKSEEAIRQSEELFRITFQSIGDAVITTDTKGEIINMNPIAEDLTGWALADALTLPLSSVVKLISKGSRERITNLVDRVLDGGRAVHIGEDSLLIDRDGNERDITDNGAPILNFDDEIVGVVLIFRDVSNEVALRNQLARSKKMETVGTLAGGIAHDFNNMLGGILGSAEILETFLIDDPEAKIFHRLIVDTCERAGEMVDKLLTFSRKQEMGTSLVDLHHSISNTVILLRNTLDKRINIQLELNAEDCHLIGEAALIESSLLNLGINASHSMPEGGLLTIHTSNVELDSTYCELSSFNISPGRFLRVEVSDTGFGISLEDREKIFEPFFSTKGVGEGTGLGLAVVYGTMKNHKGAVSLYSEVDKGSSFHLLFPVHGKSSSVQEGNKELLVAGEGTILVVDDEEIMRTTANSILSHLGYKVVLAKDGKDALDIFLNSVVAFDLILLDMVMPNLNGRDCLREIRKVDQEVKVILSSGFSRKEDVKEMENLGIVSFIQKPYRSAVLSRVVFDALQV